jgi:hypothetical protein
VRIAGFARHRAGLIHQPAVFRAQPRGGKIPVRTFVPVDGERITAASCRPGIAGIYHHAERQLPDVHHAGYRARHLVIDLQHLCADDRRPRHHCVQHAGNPHVETEFRAAVHLHGRIEAPLRLAEVTELRGILEHHLFRHGFFRGGIGELSVTQGLVAVKDPAVLGTQRVRVVFQWLAAAASSMARARAPASRSCM